MKKLCLIIFVFSLLANISLAQIADFDFTDVCLGETTTLTSTSTSSDPIVSFEWDLTNNGSFTDASGATINQVFTQTGVYTIGLRITTSTGSANAIYHQVAVGNYPTVNFSYENACANDFTKFRNLSSAAGENLEDFIWDFGDGVTDNFSTHPGHWYVFPGIYNVKLIAITDYGCKDSISKSVEINSLPTLTIEFQGDTIFDEGGSVIVSATGDFDRIVWSTGETYSPITITTGGYYFAQVFKVGCPTTKSFNIIVHDRTGVTNLITPNGDGYNDFWEIFHIEDHAPCQVDIYSREGVKVYSSLNYNNSWDGTFNGKPLAEGTYIYIAKCKDNKIQKGTINILR